MSDNVCVEISEVVNNEDAGSKSDNDEDDTLSDQDDTSNDEEVSSNDGMDIYMTNQETVDLKTTLMIEILQHPMAAYWETAAQHQPYALNPVKENSEEFEKIRTIFEATSDGKKIRVLERVENPFLLARYLLKREKLKMEKQVFHELNLFHGTTEKNVDGICKLNFNWRRCLRARYGTGVYFAKKSSKASNYSSQLMFLVKVLVSDNVSLGNKRIKLPPEQSDATGDADKSIIVKYEDDEFYPQYVIHLTQLNS